MPRRGEGDQMNLHMTKTGDVAILIIEGRIGWNSSRLLDGRVRALVKEGVRHVVFQLDVDFLSSGAIGVVVYYLRSLQKAGGDIFLVTSRPYVYELLDSIGFLKVFAGKVFESLDDMRTGLVKRGISMPDIQELNFDTVESSLDSVE
jgi:anti-anti-sigma factor